MNKRKVIISLTIVIVFVLVFAILFYYTKSDTKKSNNNQTTEDIANNIDYQMRVCYGALESTYIVEGKVISDEYEYTDIYEYNYDTSDKVNINVKIGQEISRNDELYSINGNKTLSGCDGFITNITNRNNKITVSVLNYSLLYVTVNLPYEIYTQLSYESEVSVKADNKIYSADIKKFGSICVDDYVETQIKFAGYIMPGKKVETEIFLGRTDEITYINSDMVTTIGGISYCNVYSDVTGTPIINEQEIITGDTYNVVDDGNKFTYIEILSGLSKDDIVVKLK